ncbi:Glycosyl hydrolases family 43 [compost metagenome]
MMSNPLFRDPIMDGAADPTVIWNHVTEEWWMIYTNRRATVEGPGVAWVHGTDLGVAVSRDEGRSWVYRGTLQGLEFEWGRNTFWAPEIIYHEGTYHMYVSYIQGVPVEWPGHERHIIHYTSPDLQQWTLMGRLPLSSNRVIDACVYPLPDGRFRMWYKDEANHSHTYAADSTNLIDWEVVGPVLTHCTHEGPNVFFMGDSYWMIVDEWRGQGVFRSVDAEQWERTGLILDQSGTRQDDSGVGLHADVVVQGEEAYIFYFTHPGRSSSHEELTTYGQRRTSIQVAKLKADGGTLLCDRNAECELRLERPLL